jgi:hypothetical protein
MADGKKLPRWKPRLTRCIHMGLSSQHASTVPIVLDPSTGYITQKFHVVFDNWFSTIASTVKSLPDFNSAAWSKLFGKSTYKYPFDDDDAAAALPDSDPFNDSAVIEQTLQEMDSVAAAMDRALPATPFHPPLHHHQPSSFH